MIVAPFFYNNIMEVKKQHKGKTVWSDKAGMLLEVNTKNYPLLKETHKDLYVTPSKKSTNKSSADLKGESDS